MFSIEKSRLQGIVHVSGAKNSALKQLAASLLTSEPIVISNYPGRLSDIKIHEDMLKVLGKQIIQRSDREVEVREDSRISSTLEWSGRSIRNTLLILGALVARVGYGRVPLPGGCVLGDRKHDLHILVLESLGAKVSIEDGYLVAEAKGRLRGADIHLPLRSTGATENAILAGALASGVTRIWNPHIRPEILDLIALLRAMGANVTVFGQEHIEVVGVESLGGAEHRVMADNMEAVTWLVAASITGGDVQIEGFPFDDLEVVLVHLKAAGARLFRGDNSVIVRGARCFPIEISTGPHPGINSDVQPILAAWAANAKGGSKLVDLRFPGRYGYATELAKLGVSCEARDGVLTISGSPGELVGAPVRALDLRAGAALLLCGLTAVGRTTIEDAWQIGRGYENIVEKLQSLGATCEGEVA